MPPGEAWAGQPPSGTGAGGSNFGGAFYNLGSGASTLTDDTLDANLADSAGGADELEVPFTTPETSLPLI